MGKLHDRRTITGGHRKTARLVASPLARGAALRAAAACVAAAALSCMAAPSPAHHGESLVIAPENPKAWETTACGELSALLAKAAGGGAVTVDGRDGVRFHVGDTELARENGLLSSQLPDEQWVVRSFGADVVLNGGGSHGALYAVSHFLEDFVPALPRTHNAGGGSTPSRR